ncbi:hypothetical protein GUITHDRAFT_105260 [Guillardia theta CCMP2712]|uniref:Reverse transcriptase domain-containing protein n=1 Tax=Guillardia theta (strain CCMP2712) TaxID=905079 RepID=L1JLV9_GUITC|nr:hypothetical protein GUITHDRAFT_105260 [Guillardia theta CCMP2712]EKX49184.1 hypothetical protein GUITHDRAFT_105260 [Guillardia theta CCMP2712]|eukprot:XP_005836164.1 hypothetical protein GUITHDRAFT_105260 [Guillardia theta CCMP2712]
MLQLAPGLSSPAAAGQLRLLWDALPLLLLSPGPRLSINRGNAEICHRVKSGGGRSSQAPLPAPRESAANGRSLERRKLDIALEHYENRDLHKARRTLTGAGLRTDDFDQIYHDTLEKFPHSPSPVSLLDPGNLQASRHQLIFGEASGDDEDTDSESLLDAILHEKHVNKVLSKFTKSAAADLTGWRPFQFLRPILRMDEATKDAYKNFILKPLLLGYGTGIDQIDSLLRGGIYYPAAKPGKPGLRPIIIGSLQRRLSSSLFTRYHRSDLTHFFTQAHPRVIQHSGGLEDGAIRFAKLLQCTLGPFTHQHIPSEATLLAYDPVVMIGLDCKNAFNSLSRRALLDTLLGTASQGYFASLGEGFLARPGDQLPQCGSFAHRVLPYVSHFYQGDCRLFLKRGTQARPFDCSRGVHQGDPAGLSLFCHALHPFLMRVADKHTNCTFPLYADNITVVGRLSDASAAVKDLIDTLRDDLALDIQPRDSKVFSPSWVDLPPEQHSAIVAFIKREFAHLRSFSVEMEGVVAGGIPLGSRGFISNWLRDKLAALDDDLHKLGSLSTLHPFACKHLIRATHLPTLQYFLRGIDPEMVTDACTAFDQSVLLELGKAFDWPSSDGGSDIDFDLDILNPSAVLSAGWYPPSIGRAGSGPPSPTRLLPAGASGPG